MEKGGQIEEMMTPCIWSHSLRGPRGGGPRAEPGPGVIPIGPLPDGGRSFSDPWWPSGVISLSLNTLYRLLRSLLQWKIIIYTFTKVEQRKN